MVGLRKSIACSFVGLCTSFALFLSLASPVKADSDVIEWIPYTTDDGTIYLDNDRRPSLYTGSFGDCQGNSLIEISRFDASLYTDNMTVMIHLEGTTNLPEQKVIMLISVEAYGESRLDMIINPCTIDTPTLCPMRPGVPIVANGLIPIAADNLADVPSIAYSIPDFEGQAVLKFFNYPSQQQLGCYAAAMTNGNSFSQPDIVGSILGLFTIIALVSSVAVAVYGHVVPETRLHHAHSISIFVVFSVFHHIFFSGTLSVHWPSVLVAFWTNYAWAAGIIYTESMQDSINNFLGHNHGNVSKIGATPANTNVSNLGGVYDASKVDGIARFAARSVLQDAEGIMRRSSIIEDKSTGFVWYGDLVKPGLPLPGNYTGFAGTLSELSIPASNVFLTGLIWLLILMLIVSVSIIALKVVVELCVQKHWIKSNGWNFFRAHWLKFTGVAILRLCFIAFFMMTTLTLFQFAFGGTAGVLALATIVFLLFVTGLFASSGYALWYRLRSETFETRPDRLHIVSRKRGIGFELESAARNRQINHKIIHSFPWTEFAFVDPENRPHVHEDAEYIIKFGWMASRFRRSRWWFFSLWLFYELVRACFHGGAVTNSLAQVIGLLVWELFAFIAIVLMKPFESSRLNMVVVYFLGFSKIVTAGLSIALDPHFALGRILATAIGIIIIIVQGLLTISLLVAIALGAVSSYLSIKRDQTNSEFKPRRWVGYRARYFEHIEQKATDQRVMSPVPDLESEKAKEPQFSVTTIRREPKIEDLENPIHENNSNRFSQISIDQESPVSPYISRPASIRSHASNIPFGARMSRATWSARDLSNIGQDRAPTDRHQRTSLYSMTDTTTRHRSTSLRNHAVRPQSFHSMDYDTRAKRRRTMSAVQPRLRDLQTSSVIESTDASSSDAIQSANWPLRPPPPQQQDTQESDDVISVTESEAWPPANWGPDDILPQDPFHQSSSDDQDHDHDSERNHHPPSRNS